MVDTEFIFKLLRAMSPILPMSVIVVTDSVLPVKVFALSEIEWRKLSDTADTTGSIFEGLAVGRITVLSVPFVTSLASSLSTGAKLYISYLVDFSLRILLAWFGRDLLSIRSTLSAGPHF